MYSITADIKNLSIALEALSRFPGAQELSETVMHELECFMHELARRRRISEEDIKNKTQTNIPDDDIPS